MNLSRIVNNTVISLLGQAVTWASTLMLTIAYGRFLGDVRFGNLYFAITFVMLIGFPIEVGFNQQLTRDVAQNPELALRYLSNILLIKFGLWIVLYGLLIALCWALGYSSEVHVLVVICGITLLSGSVANTFSASHYAFERVVFPVIGNILEKGLAALLGVLLLKSGAGVKTMALVLLLGSLANACWQAGWFFRLVGFQLTLERKLIRLLLQTSIPFILSGVLGVIYYRLDTVLLSLLTSNAVVGWYGAAYRIFDTLVFLPSLVINAIMYPVFSRLSLNSSASLRTAGEKSLNFLLFCSLPIATLMIVATPSIVGFLYHRAEFLPTIPAMQGLAPGLVFLYINSVLTSIIISIKQEKKITLMAGIALVFNLTLNLFLIPHYQHIGAAIVTSLTELLLGCIALACIPRALLPVGSWRVAVKAFVACLVMGLILWPLRNLHIFLILPVALVVYLGMSLLLKTFPREDMQSLLKAVRRKTESREPAPLAHEEALDKVGVV